MLTLKKVPPGFYVSLTGRKNYKVQHRQVGGARKKLVIEFFPSGAKRANPGNQSGEVLYVGGKSRTPPHCASTLGSKTAGRLHLSNPKRLQGNMGPLFFVQLMLLKRPDTLRVLRVKKIPFPFGEWKGDPPSGLHFWYAPIAP